ncbi:MAG: MBL fold metallo-hydrolase [Acidimicrobiia bacterium]|nr:MBL fold metallo-hydrolase [Acidimicrobiia bacterium]
MDDTSRQWHYADDEILVDRAVVGSLANNVFLLVDPATTNSVIIDASTDAATILEMAKGTKVQAVLTTHGHWDHVGAASEVGATLGIPVYIGPEDKKMGKLPQALDLEAGPMALGNLQLEIIATPGHTSGSRCIKVGHLIFTGDTLFPGGPGATRSPDDFRTIMKSLDDALFTQPDATMIMPGHGLDTTIGAERPHVEEWRARGW